MGVLSLKAAPRSPAREALAAAITNHVEAKTYLTGLRSSLTYDGAAATAVREARNSLRLAEEALADVRADTVTRMGGIVQPNVAPVVSIREARANISEAEELLDAARIARRSIEVEVSGVERDLGFREYAVRDRALEVLKEEVGPWGPAYFAEVERLKRELEQISGEANWLLDKGVFIGLGLDSQHAGTRRSGEVKWEAELDALMTNADAPAPAKSGRAEA